jgi:hypothetical protein
MDLGEPQERFVLQFLEHYAVRKSGMRSSISIGLQSGRTGRIAGKAVVTETMIGLVINREEY